MTEFGSWAFRYRRLDFQHGRPPQRAGAATRPAAASSHRLAARQADPRTAGVSKMDEMNSGREPRRGNSGLEIMFDLMETMRTAVALIALVSIAGGAFVGAQAFVAVIQ